MGNTLGFYPKRDLEPLKSDIEIREPKTKILVSKLKSCIPGRQQWKQYQSICKEILCYCLVPPLLEPIEQSATIDNLHIRDLIFNIPLDLGGFWTYITNRFGLALIFECKNYEDYVRQNELVISSKYVGNRKLTEMGLMVTRKGLHENAQKTQENLWKEQGKMLLCLNDNDLEKMVELKEKNDEPWKVIDNKIREFLVSLS